jgi:hypothetical protein
MSIDNPGVKPVWADQAAPADILEPSDARKRTGFTREAPCPPYNVLNWLWNHAIGVVSYLKARGIADYDPKEDYRPGDCTQFPPWPAEDGAVYRCKAPCRGVEPTDADHWEFFGVRGNWLADALKDRLVSTLPEVAGFVTSMAAKLGIWKGFTAQQSSGFGWTTLKVFGIQISHALVTFEKSGGYPVSLALTWPAEFGSIEGVIATPYATNNLYLNVAAKSTTNATITPETIAGASFPGDVKAFVLAVGTAKTGVA